MLECYSLKSMVMVTMSMQLDHIEFQISLEPFSVDEFLCNNKNVLAFDGELMSRSVRYCQLKISLAIWFRKALLNTADVHFYPYFHTVAWHSLYYNYYYSPYDHNNDFRRQIQLL